MTHAELYNAAWAAGVEAAAAAVPQMITVANPFTGETYESFPICGFASVIVKPGNSAFARWLKANKGAGKHYYGGVYLWISSYNQSYNLKLAHAEAMAKVFRDNGINAHAEGRLD